MDQLLENSKFSEDEILEMTENLAKKGVIFNQPNSGGVVVYRLLSLVNVGVFEYTFMQKLVRSEADGLVHKAYHPNFNVAKKETSVCNCCKCCCGNSIDNQIGPIINAANFLAVVNPDTCTG